MNVAEHKAEKAMDSENLVEEKTMTADFDFTELKFVKSSRMLKRWLVFHCTIQVQNLGIGFLVAARACFHFVWLHGRLEHAWLAHPCCCSAALTLPAACSLQGDLLYCIYDLPSVIVSRPNDQYRKVCEMPSACVSQLPPPLLS